MRLDLYIVKEFNLESRSKALDLIKTNQVMVNGQLSSKQSYDVKPNDQVEIIKQLEYVSRGGNKLEDAINFYHLEFKDKVLLDVGSSTGGFTDCALKHGAKKVYAYDVGSDQLHESLRSKKEIELHENTNILDVLMPVSCDYVSIDVSFTSVKPILTHLKDIQATFIVLVKPQFEVGKKEIKNGIVKDEKKQTDVVLGMIRYMNYLGFTYIGHKKSDLLGKKGNQEYLLVMKKGE